MIQIGRPYIEQAGKNFRLTADVVMDQETKKWWFEVPAEYKQYLCTERSDAFLIGILPLAMRFGEDISLDAPVTEERLTIHTARQERMRFVKYALEMQNRLQRSMVCRC